MFGSNRAPKWPIMVPFCGMDPQKSIFLKVAQIKYVSRNKLHCTANLNFGLMYKKAKHCFFIFVQLIYFLDYVLLLAELAKKLKLLQNSCIAKWFHETELQGIFWSLLWICRNIPRWPKLPNLLNKNEILSLTVIFVDCQLWKPMAPWLPLAGSRGPANCNVFLLGGGDLDL